MATLYESLLIAAKASPGGGFSERKPGQPRDIYLAGMTRAIATVSDEVWKALPVPAAEWFNQSVIMINSDHPPPPLDGFDGTPLAEDEPDAVSGAQMMKAPTPINKAGAKQPVKTPSAKASAQAVNGKGVSETVREVVIENPDWTVEQIKKHLDGIGMKDVKTSSITTLRADTTNVMKIAIRLGWQRSEPTKPENAA